MLAKLRQLIPATDPIEAFLAAAAFGLMILFPFGMVYLRWGAEACAGFTSLFFLAHCLRSRDWAWLKEWPVIIILLLWLYSLLVVTPLAVDSHASLIRAGWVRFVLMFVALVYWLSHYPKAMQLAACVVGGFLLFIAAVALTEYVLGLPLLQYIGMNGRLKGPFTREVVGIFLAKMAFPFCGILLLSLIRQKHHRLVGLCMLALAAIFMTIILSNERTAIVTFVLGLGVVMLACWVAYQRARKFLLLAVLLICAALVGLYNSQGALETRIKKSVDVVMNFSESPYGKLWQAAVLVAKKHPLTGAGLTNFRTECTTLENPDIVEACNLHPHNIYLEWLSELGAIGLIGFVVFVVSLGVWLIKEPIAFKEERYVAKSFACAALIVTFFPLAATQSFFSNWPALLAWYSVAWALASVRSARHG